MTTSTLGSAPDLIRSATSTLVNYTFSDPISSKDLFGMVQSIATLNLGYLGIAVTIIALLGGAFIYFNINPLKDLLSKQEKRLRKTEEMLTERFEKIEDDQKSTFDNLFLRLESKTTLLSKRIKNSRILIKQEVVENLNIFKNSNNQLIDEAKKWLSLDVSNKTEILKQETENKRLEMEANLTQKISQQEKLLLGEISTIRKELAHIKNELKEFEISIKELEVEEYRRKGQQGAIINMIELLETDINKNNWKITGRLQNIKEHVEKHALTAYVYNNLMTALTKIAEKAEYKELVDSIKKSLELRKD